MTSHLDSHRTTDIKADMLLGVQTGNGTPHEKYNIRGIAALHIYWSGGKGLDIFRFAVFFAGATRRAGPDSMLILCLSVCVCI